MTKPDWVTPGGRYDGLLRSVWGPAAATGPPMAGVGLTLNAERLVSLTGQGRLRLGEAAPRLSQASAILLILGQESKLKYCKANICFSSQASKRTFMCLRCPLYFVVHLVPLLDLFLFCSVKVGALEVVCCLFCLGLCLSPDSSTTRT
jgi:hypothetical protein